MRYLLLLAEPYLYFLCGCLILKHFCQPKKPIQKAAVCFLLHAVLFALLFLLKPENVALCLLLIIAFDMLTLCIIFKEIKPKSIFSLYIFLYSVYFLISSVLTFIFNMHAARESIGFIGICSSVLIFVICVITCISNPSVILLLNSIPKAAKRICITSIASSAVLASLLLVVVALNDITLWNSLVKTLIVIFITVIGSVFPVLIASSIGKEYYSRRSEMFEAQLILQAKHYEEVAKANFELHRFKHDYKNMLIGVCELIEEGIPEKAMDMLRRGNGIISEELFCGFDTGNGIVNAILSEKQRKAEEAKATIQFDGVLSSTKIEPVDLCVIFGNTLDNAIEACERMPDDDKKIIRVSCRSAGGFVFINIQNPINENIKISKNSIPSTKKNSKEHGYGLYSLKKATKKYDGVLKFDCNDNIFTLDIELSV